MWQGLFKLLSGRFLKSKFSKIRGFTLIEVLVAAFISGLIVSTLLAFLTSILQTDQREEAKVQTQEEIQAALDFIADDLKEAVYIYDADGVERVNNDATPTESGIADQLPELASTPEESIPVLVFWKRVNYDRGPLIGPSNTTLGYFIDDHFTYALVAYYLRSNRLQNLERSAAMQIERFELRDGIKAGAPFRSDAAGTTIPTPVTLPPNECEVADASNIEYYVPPDALGSGNFCDFNNISTTGDTTRNFRSQRNTWKSRATAYDSPNSEVLLDFVDDNFYRTTQDDLSGSVLNSANDPLEIPIRPNTTFPTNANGVSQDNADCANPEIGVGRTPANGLDLNGVLAIPTQRIPSVFNSSSTALGRADNASSFFACVNSEQNIARVWIRGNGIARQIPQRSQFSRRQVTALGDPKANNITTASIRAFGRTSLRVR